MKKSLNVQNVSETVSKAVRYIYALHSLLDALAEDHFIAELSGARKEAGAPDDDKGSFWWMQNHYCSAKASANAATCLAAMLERVLVDLDDDLPAITVETSIKTSPRGCYLSPERLFKTNSRGLFTKNARNEKIESERGRKII